MLSLKRAAAPTILAVLLLGISSSTAWAHGTEVHGPAEADHVEADHDKPAAVAANDTVPAAAPLEPVAEANSSGAPASISRAPAKATAAQGTSPGIVAAGIFAMLAAIVFVAGSLWQRSTRRTAPVQQSIPIEHAAWNTGVHEPGASWPSHHGAVAQQHPVAAPHPGHHVHPVG